MEKNKVGKAARVYRMTEKGEEMVAFLGKLPYRFGSEAWQKRLKEAISSSSESAKVVNCFGTDKFEILQRQLVVKIFNKKTGTLGEPAFLFEKVFWRVAS